MTSSFFKKILLSTDFSTASENALNTAISVCQQHGSNLILVHVIDNSMLHFTEQSRIIFAPVQQLVGIAKENLNSLAIAISRSHNIFVNYDILVGKPAAEICQYAEKNFFDLIVIGKRTESISVHQRPGDVTFQIVKFSSVPVLCIPAGKLYTKFTRIVFPVLEGTSIPKIEYTLIKAFVQRSSAMLVVAGIAKITALSLTPSRLIRLLELIVSKTNHDGIRSSKRMSECENIPLEVIRISKDENADLILITDHPLARNFRASNNYTLKVLSGSSCAVLSLNASTATMKTQAAKISVEN